MSTSPASCLSPALTRFARLFVALAAVVLALSPLAAFAADLPKSPDTPQSAEEFFVFKRAPAGTTKLPVEKWDAAREHMTRMPVHSTVLATEFDPVSAELLSTQALGTWTQLGPGNIGGRTRALVVDPNTPATMYAAGVAGGVWKTTNSGASWTPLTDLTGNLAVSTLAMQRGNSNIIFAGTGEGFFNGDAVQGDGILASFDAGATWTQLASTRNSPDFQYVNKIVISPNGLRIYAATRTGIMRSLDGGINWTHVLTVDVRGGCTDLAIRTDLSADYVFASCGTFAQATIWRNTDAGVSPVWTPVFTESGMGRTSLAFAPSNQAIVYALSAEIGGGAFQDGLHAVFRSTDSGTSWTARVRNTSPTKLNTVLLSYAVFAFNSTCSGAADQYLSQGWYDNVIAVDPTNPDNVWVGGVDLFRSTDGGANWTIASYWWGGVSTPSYVHGDQHAIVFHPGYNGTTNQTLFVGNDGGIFRTSNAASGTTSTDPCGITRGSIAWTELNNNYVVTQFYHGLPYPDGASYFGGTQDTGTVRGTDAAGIDGWSTILGGNGGYVAVDPTNTNVLYAEDNYLSIQKSTDGGSNWASAIAGITGDPGFLFVTPFMMDPGNSQRLWTGGYYVWRTSNGAATWDRASMITCGSGSVTAIAVAPTNANHVLAGMSDGCINRTTSGTTSGSATPWSFSTPRSGYVSSLRFDPTNENVVYATYATFGGAHVWRSVDGGTTWSSIDGVGSSGIPDVPVHSILANPGGMRLYVGTDVGVFVSRDSGGTWAVENTGFANVITESLAATNIGSVPYIFAFTHGRGAWRVPAQDQLTVTVTKTGTGTGTVTSSPAGIDCGATCSHDFSAGTTVTLTATADPGSTFSSWTGCASSSGATCMVGSSGSVSITASFATARPGDDRASPIDITTNSFTDFRSTASYTTAADDPVPSCVPQRLGATIWYRFTPSQSGQAAISTPGSGYDTVISVHQASNLAAVSGGCNDDSSGTLQSSVAVNLTAGTTYLILVGAYSLGPGGSHSFSFTFVPGGSVFQWSSATYSVAEGAGFATLTVTRTGSVTNSATVDYMTSGGTATAGIHYLATSGAAVFAPGETSKTFGIVILDDTVVNTSRTVNLLLLNPVGGTLGTPSTAVLTITDDDNGGTIAFESATYSVNENAGTVVVAVVRAGTNLASGVTVAYGTSNGTATAGSDYTATFGTLTFAAGETRKTFSVPIIDDTLVEGNETFTVSLSAPTGGATLGSPSATTVSIVDDDAAPTVQFSSAAYSVNEAGSSAPITVTRTGSTSGITTVNFSTGDGTWAQLAPAGGPPQLNSYQLTAVRDHANNRMIAYGRHTPGEFNEVWVLTSANGLGGAPGWIKLTTAGGPPAGRGNHAAVYDSATNRMIIFGGCGGGCLPVLNDVWVLTEANGLGGTPTWTQLSPIGSPPTARHAVAAGYDPSTNRLTIFGGHNGGGSGGSTYSDTWVLTNANGLGGTPQWMRLSPVGGPPPGQYQPSFAHDAASNRLTVTGGGAQGTGAWTNAVWVLTSANGLGGTPQWINLIPEGAAGSPAAFFGAAAARDTVNNRMTVIVPVPGVSSLDSWVLSNANGLGGTSQWTRLSVSGGPPQGGIAANGAVYDPASDRETVLFVTGPVPCCASWHAEAWVLGNPGSAIAGTHYLPTSGTLVFAAGETSKTFAVSILNDTIANPDRAVNLAVSNVSGGVLGIPSTAVLTIVNDDNGGTVAFRSGALSVNESAGLVVVEVVRTGTNLASGVTVAFATQNGTAIAGSDYTATSGTLTFGAGETSKTFSVPITSDSLFEGNETFQVVLSTPGGGGVLGSPTTATVTIIDAESAPSVQFWLATYSILEVAQVATITVTRAGTTAGVTTVDYATVTGGTAVANRDYVPASGTLTFNPGETQKFFTVGIIRNTAVNPDVTVNLALSGVSGGVLGSQSTAVLTIVDFNTGGVIAFNSSSYSANETAGSVLITVVRTGVALASGVSVNYATANGTATAGSDYTAVSGTLTFDADVTTRTFVVPILDDNVSEGNETFQVLLSVPTGGAVLGAPSAATVTIVDNEVAPTIQFSSATYTVGEAAGSAPITVVRDGVTTGTSTVNFATSNGTGIAGTHYVPASGTLTFGPGDTSKTFTVSVLDDTVVNPDRTVNLLLSNPSGATLGISAGAQLTIVNNDNGGTIALGSATYTVNENAGSVTIDVARTGTNLASGVTVRYATANGTASAGIGYTSTSGTLTFAAGETRRAFTVPILDNTIADGNKTFQVSLSSPTGGAVLGSPTTATVTILDNEVLVAVQFSTSSYSVGEAGGAATITVTRSGSTSGTTTVQYATSNGTAIAGTNYIAASGTLTFAPGDTSKTFTVSVLDDAVVNPDRTVNLALSNPSGAALGSPVIAQLTIVNDDTGGTIAFGAAAYSVNENAGSVTIDVMRTGTSLGGGVTVRYATSDGTAREGSDYTSTSGTLTFGPGGTRLTFTVPILDDNLTEGNETFQVTLSAPGGGGILGARTSATVTIVDDESVPVIRFSATTYSVSEGGGTATVTVMRDGVTTGTSTVNFATSNGTGLAGTHYVATSGTLTFGPGETSKSFLVGVIDNTVVDPDRTVNLTLSNPTAAALGSAATAVLTIVNDDDGGTISFSTATYSVAETAGFVTIEVVRTGGKLASGVTVRYASANVTATAGSDYVATSGTLTFAALEARRTFTVPILNDALVEGAETFQVSLSAPQGGGVLGTPSTATVTIVDDDVATLQFSMTAYSVRESGGLATIAVTRTGSTTSTATVNYATSDGTATANTHYMPVSGTLVFGPGVTSRTFTVGVIDNTVVNPDRTVNLTLSAPAGAFLGTSTAVLTITNDDNGGTIAFSSPSYTIAENLGSVTITVVRTGTNLASGVTVAYATANGTATAGSDYTAVSGTLTFEANATSRTFVVPILDDNVYEGNETFQVSLSAPTGGAVLGSPATATVTIVDNEVAPTIHFSAGTYTAGEAAGSTTITVTRTPATSDTATVNFATADDTAVAGRDYTATSGTLTFGPGETSTTFTVGIIDNTTVNPDRRVSLRLAAPSGATLGAPSTAVLTIRNDDVGGTVGFSAPIGTCPGPMITPCIRTPENSGSVVIEVVRSSDATNAPLASGVTVRYTTVDGTAKAGVNYTTTAGTLTFAAGETRQSFTVPIMDNTVLDRNKSFQVVLSPPEGGATLRMQAGTATVTIVDDETIAVQFSQAGYEVVEGGAATITVMRTGPTTGRVFVSYRTDPVPGGAIPGTDYTAATGTLTFEVGETTKTFTVQTNHNTVVAPNRSLRLRLSDPTGTDLGDPSVATLTIRDDDNGGVIAFRVANLTVAEDGGVAVIEVVRDGTKLASGVTVRYQTTDGTARGNVDYRRVTGTLTFLANVRSLTFSVPILNDTLLNPSRSFQASLTAPTGGGQLGAPSTVTVTITDDESAGTFEFDRDTYSVNEKDGSALIAVRRTGTKLAGGVQIGYATTAGGTATAGVDYTPLTAGVLTFGPNEMSKTFSVRITNDTVLEATETINLTLSVPSGSLATLGPRRTATLTIRDDDTICVEFFPYTQRVVEGQLKNVSVFRTGGLGTRLTVGYSVDLERSTAIEGTDYTLPPPPHVVVFPAVSGTASQPGHIPVQTRATPESAPRILILKLEQTDPPITCFGNREVTISIVDR